MMLPILISVSVAPVSYFFCAIAPLLVAASTAMAAENAPLRNWIAGIWISLISVGVCHVSLTRSTFRLLPALNTFPANPARKSPLRRGRRGPYLVAAGAAIIPPGETWSVAEIAADDVAEQFPLLALEPHHLQLRDRREVGGQGGDRDAGQHGVGHKILQ